MRKKRWQWLSEEVSGQGGRSPLGGLLAVLAQPRAAVALVQGPVALLAEEAAVAGSLAAATDAELPGLPLQAAAGRVVALVVAAALLCKQGGQGTLSTTRACGVNHQGLTKGSARPLYKLAPTEKEAELKVAQMAQPLSGLF